MTSEEKAKEYDEAIKRAKAMIKVAANQDEAIDFVNTIFPKFKEESKDENIKETLIKYFKKRKKDGDCDELFCGLSYNDIIAWFEKQGEQNSIINDILTATNYDKMFQNCNVHRFNIGDKIKLIKEPKYPAREIIAIKNGAYYFDEAVHLPFSHQDEWELVEQKSAWGKEDAVIVNSILSCIEHCKIEDIEAQYNGNHNVDPKRYESMSNWIKELKDRVQPQPKQEWSEDDIEMIDYVASILNSNFNENDKFDDNKPCVGALVDRLKCIKDRIQFKQK